jgi:hypothetical protein
MRHLELRWVVHAENLRFADSKRVLKLATRRQAFHQSYLTITF